MFSEGIQCLLEDISSFIKAKEHMRKARDKVVGKDKAGVKLWSTILISNISQSTL